MQLKQFLVPKKILRLREELKAKGFKAFARDLGWKVIVLIILFYLIRDSILYILIPFLIARGIFLGK